MSMPEVLPEDILSLINAAVSQAVQQTKAALETVQQPVMNPKSVNYFKTTEKLLYSYPKLKRLIADKEAYTSVALKERSKSIIQFSGNHTYKSKEDIIEEMQTRKENQYEQTLSDFRHLDEILAMFTDRKEFIIIRMYYFNEEADGREREHDEPKYTWEEISWELSDRDILRDEKTARRWRTNIVNEIAVCLFGFEAALVSA